MWFESLFGVPEADGASVRRQFRVDGDRLVAPNGRRFGIGRFSTPSLGDLRATARSVGRPGEVRVTHQVIGDVLELHAVPDNAGDLFQVASQFNCLEFPSPNVVPEDGVTGYAHDPTQGPACSLAAAAATVYRNYFAMVDGRPGQSRDRQLDTLADLARRLGSDGQYWTMRNGYVESDHARLDALRRALTQHRTEDLRDAVRVGLQTRVEVTFAQRFVVPETPTYVSQAFCAAVPCGYAPAVPTAAWAPLACLVLEAAYEATLWAAIRDGATGEGSGRVWLTLVGGGVFANEPEWITGAIRRAVDVVQGYELDVRVAHYGERNPAFLW